MRTYSALINVPERLKADLEGIPYAHYLGQSPGGVDWVAYAPSNVRPMRKRLRQMILKAALTKAASAAKMQRRADARWPF
jgi:hypothetical protein